MLDFLFFHQIRESIMTVNDVIHQRRIHAVAHAGQIGNITHAAAVFGISRQTLAGWIGLAARHGFDALLPKDRRPGHQPTGMAPGEIETIIAEAVARPTLRARTVNASGSDGVKRRV